MTFYPANGLDKDDSSAFWQKVAAKKEPDEEL
jgi:hypothetical protein